MQFKIFFILYLLTLQGAGIPSLVCNILSYKTYPTVPEKKEEFQKRLLVLRNIV